MGGHFIQVSTFQQFGHTGSLETESSLVHSGDHRFMLKHVSTGASARFEQSEEVIRLRESLFDYRWVYRDACFERLTRLVSELQPAGEAWIHYLRTVCGSWKHFETFSEAAHWSETTRRLHHWQHWLDWLYSIRPCLRHQELNEDICIGLLRAIHIAAVELGVGLNETSVAKRVNISRSYFSRCFKRYTGITFHEFLKQLHIERASMMLQSTDMSMDVIANICGFKDERYFNHFYRRHTGKYPKEARSQWKKQV